MILVQISDLHVQAPPGQSPNPRCDEGAALATAVAAINALDPRPDLVIATGDLVNRRSPEEYAALRDLLAPLAPRLRMIPGNHDGRAALRAAFPAHSYWGREGFMSFAEDHGPLRIVGLDTVMADSHGGELCAERLAWLDQTLTAGRGRPTIIAMHHPPFLTGMPNFDRLGFAGAEGFAAVMARHPQVERILCGHVHRAITARVGGALASVGPSTAYTYAFTLTEAGRFALSPEPPGFAVHVWDGTRLVSHVVPLPGTLRSP